MPQKKYLPIRKLIYAGVTSAVVFAVTKLGLPWDPKLEQGLNAVLPLIVGYFVPNGAKVAYYDSEPEDDDGKTTLGTDVAAYYDQSPDVEPHEV